MPRAPDAPPEATPAGDGWMPIETAPRDYLPVLTWDPYYLMRVARRDTSSGSWITDLPFDWERGGKELRVEPTHWRPLPAPPAAGEAGGG